MAIPKTTDPDHRSITHAKVVKFFGTGQAAAEWFGISPEAVSMWPRDKVIPHLRELQLRAAFPGTNWDRMKV